jgi:hypothetical protein
MNENKKIKVLIAAPICQNSDVLKEYLNSLVNLDKINLNVHFLFIDDNNDNNSKLILHKFCKARKKSRVIASNKINGTKFNNVETKIYKIINFRNFILHQACNEDFDYLFTVDSNIILNPKTLQHLINYKKDIISEIYWESEESKYFNLPNVWLADSNKLYYYEKENWFDEKTSNREIKKMEESFLNKLKRSGVYEVGGATGCLLIGKKVIRSKISYDKIANLTFWGENCHFCIRAAVLGFKIFVDTFYPASRI